MTLISKQNPLGTDLDKNFRLKLNITSAGLSVKIPLFSLINKAYSFIVDWGDGTIEEYNNTNNYVSTRVHTYVLPGKYDFVVTTKFYTEYSMWNNIQFSSSTASQVEENNFNKAVYEIVNFGESVFFYYGFEYCTNLLKTCALPISAIYSSGSSYYRINVNFKNSGLRIVPDDFFDAVNLSKITSSSPLSLDFIFSGTKIKSLPKTFFKHFENAYVNSYSEIFNYCRCIEQFPDFYGIIPSGGLSLIQACANNYCCKSLSKSMFENLKNRDLYSINVSGLFQTVYKLSDIPEDLFWGLKLNDATSVFYWCRNLRTIPALLFKGQSLLTSASNMFYYNYINEIPVGLFKDCPNINSFNYTFGCNRITTIPEDLFQYSASKITSVNQCFYANYINEIPQLLLKGLTELTSANQLFANNYITKLPNELFKDCGKLQSFNYGFSSCKLIELPDDLFKYCPQLTNVQSCFYQNMIRVLPANLFAFNPNLMNVNLCFQYCHFQEIPNNFFANNPQLIYVNQCFDTCQYLVKVGTGLFAPNTVGIKDLSNIFNRCGMLCVIPGDLFSNLPNLENVTNAFCYTALDSIPATLFSNNPNLKICKSAFCASKIAEIPENLLINNPNITDITSMFASCPIIKLPTNIFPASCPNVLDLTSFLSGTFIREIPETFFDACTNVTNITNILSTTRLVNIPTNLFSKCTKINNFTTAFYNTDSIISDVPAFWTLFPNAIGTQCFKSDFWANNYDNIPATWK